jgi:hypothetical protein
MNSTRPSLPVRISLLVIIVACVAAGVLNLSLLRAKISCLQVNLTTQTAARQKAERDLSKTTKDLATTSTRLKETAAGLEASKAETENALAREAAQIKRAEEFKRDLAKTRAERDESQAELARFRTAGIGPEEVVRAASEIKRLQTALNTVGDEKELVLAKLNRIEELHPEDTCRVDLPPGLKTKVIASDPRWHFIILNAGEDQGVLRRGELLISRQGKLVAKARVVRVAKDSCVADLLPGWGFGDVLEGDLAIPASPGS